MIFLIFELLYTTLFSGFFLIGFGTTINRVGDFLKMVETEEKDNFSKAFDKLTNDVMSEFNKFFASSHIVISKSMKLMSIAYELFTGEKVIKKSKEGNIIISDKSALMEKYESKIEALEKKISQFKEQKKEKNSDSESSSNGEDSEEEIIEEDED
jgi:hypothetical protein